MTSAIDATKPLAGRATTQSVRDNFTTAASEITALQAANTALSSTSSPLEGDGLVGVQIVATGSTARTQHDKNEDSTSLFDFYSTAQKVAIRAGTPTDVTAAVLLAVADAEATGRGIRINPGPHVLSDAITFTKAVDLIGYGFYSQFLADSSLGASTDLLKMVPAAGTAIRLAKWSSFRTGSVSGTPGRHAINIDLTAVGAFAANVSFEQLWLGALGGKGFNLTNPTNTDGFFTSSIEKCLIENGVYLQRAGDSINIKKNVITGSNAGIDLSMVSGAAQVVIENNNITSAGGAIVLHSGNQIKILYNQIEQSATYTGAGNACIWIRGDTAEVVSTEIRGNNINGGNLVGFCVDVENALLTSIVGKNVLVCDSSDSHIDIDASAVETVIDDSNDFFVDGLLAAAKITNAGVQTYGPQIAVSSFSNSWVAYDAVNFPVRYSRNESGLVSLDGAVKDGTTTVATTIFNLPAGFRPATGIYFAVTNNNVGTWQYGTVLVTPAGNVQIISGNATLLSFGGIRFKAAL